MAKNQISIEKKWMAESDLEALKRAKEIMADKARLTAAQNIAQQQMKALGGIATVGKKSVTKTPTKSKK